MALPNHPDTCSILISGTSTGIGRATALHLASLGYRVYAGVRRDADGLALQQAAAEQNIPPGRLRGINLDVTSQDSIAAAVDQIKSIGDSHLAAIVNNAGIGVIGPVEYVPLDEWRRQFEVNFFGHIAMIQAALPLLRAHAAKFGRGSARIVNMSSIAGKISAPIFGPYSSSKFAMESLSDALRLELRPQGIYVSLINPGVINTPIWKKGEESEAAIPQDHPARQIYGPIIDGVTAAARKSSPRGIPALTVARAVAAAIQSRRPKIRYYVGSDAKTGAISKLLIPTRWFDGILAKYYQVPKQ